MSTQAKPKNAKEWYVSLYNAFEKGLNGTRDLPFHEVRKEAIATFAEKGFPARGEEYYKYNNFKPLLKHRFENAPQADGPTAEQLESQLIPNLDSHVVVFVNGHFSSSLSRLEMLPKEVAVNSLESVFYADSEIVRGYLAQQASHTEDPFIALNTAYSQDGLYVHVPEGTVLDKPLQVLFINDVRKGGFISTPRNLIVAEANSQFTVIENHLSMGSDNAYFNNVVTEVIVEASARVDHIKIQDEKIEDGFHVYNLRARQEKNSYYSLINADIGGRQVRNNFNLHLGGEHCEGHFIGFYMGSERQEIDNHTFINHAMPNCFSNELYKGILGGKAKGIFNGKIYVAEDAQKTNAYQNNKALLLSDDASVNSKPELEIFADDVKCSHGATFGQLDADALFYLRARGIPEAQAQAMLQFAFASDVFGYIKNEAVDHFLNEKVAKRFTQL